MSEPNEKRRAGQRAWNAENPVATWAHMATRSAIRRGLLVRPDACEQCGKPGRTDAHHDSHASPLAVQFWCRSCHRLHHNAERKSSSED